jgi:hypothetical protein
LAKEKAVLEAEKAEEEALKQRAKLRKANMLAAQQEEEEEQAELKR